MNSGTDTGADKLSLVWKDPRVLIHQDHVRTMLTALVTPGDRVLDVGCGYGRFAEDVARCGGRYTGWDTDPAMLAMFGGPGRTTSVEPDGLFQLVFGVLVCNVMRLTQREFRDKYIHLVSMPGRLASFEAAETYVWSRYEPGLDHLSEVHREGGQHRLRD